LISPPRKKTLATPLIKRIVLYSKFNIIKIIVHRVDEKKRHVEWDFELDQCMFLGQYSVEGQVLILPIKGDGDANITVSKCFS